jgi:hypothetical protein
MTDQWSINFDLSPDVTDPEGLADMLDKYNRAEEDYRGECRVDPTNIVLSIPCRHIRFLRANAARFEDILTTDTLRSMLHDLSARYPETQVWQLCLEWEMEQHPAGSEQIHQYYQERLAVPHTGKRILCKADIDIQSTFDAYSTYCSAYAPNDYEKRLSAATQASQSAKFAMSAERRHKKRRQDFEDALVSIALA